MRVYAAIQKDCARGVEAPQHDGMRGTEADFWKSAAYACVALRSQDSQAWRSFTASWVTGKTYAPAGCLATTVRKWLDAVVSKTAPTGELPHLRLGPAATGYACPPSNGSVTPSAGPEDTPVDVAWEGAPEAHSAAEILFGGVKAQRSGTDNPQVVHVAAPPHAPGKVDVVMDFGSGRTFTVGKFTYQSASSPTR
jgi:hypothetical protein